MASFLLWNIGQQNRDLLIRELVREHQIDIVLLVEYFPSSNGSRLASLLQDMNRIKRSTSGRFGVFTPRTLDARRITTAMGDHVELWEWAENTGTPGRFALVHGPERRNNDDGTRRVFFRRVHEMIKNHEAGSHRHSMGVGDFNANPFESVIVSVDGLHALGVRAVNDQISRHIRLCEPREDFFYNPMWRLFGQTASLDSGFATHYWHNSQAEESFWHMLDQVVIRPEESVRFPESQLRVLTTIGSIQLLTPQGVPNARIGSDHLPVIFRWDL